MAYNAEKKVLHRGMSKKILSPEVWGTKFYPNQITHIPRQKSNGRPLTREYVGQSIAEFVIIC